MKRALSRNGHIKATNEPRQYTYADNDDSKARHILGLDMTHLRPSRRNSTSSSSTNKQRSVTFSNATTAAVTVTDSSQSERGAYHSLSRKGSSPLLRRNKKTDFQIDTLKPKGSSSSLRSFYDKSRTPLVVSQQTSESSRRDFALRKGAPSIVNTSAQESEHSRQIRLMTESQTTLPQDRNRLTPSLMQYSNSSSRSLVPSIPETASDTVESISSQPSGSRISILRNITPRASVLSPTPKAVEHYFQYARPDEDPARAKINIRRPKAGTKNWFDSLDTDSSEDEDTQREPHLTDDFALNITGPMNEGVVKQAPCSSVSPLPAELPTEVPKKLSTEQKCTQSRAGPTDIISSGSPRNKPHQKRKICAFEAVDLASQSVLDLEPSDDEDNDMSRKKAEVNTKNRIGSRGLNGLGVDPRVEFPRPQPAIVEPLEKTPQPQPQPQPPQKNVVMKQPVPRRVSSRMITYLDDCSTETVTQQEDLLTAFPQTPTDTPSRSSSLREYMTSEDEGPLNTKIMTVTRQEESLIAAMRLKKTAMKRAQAIVHRQSALSTLERNSTSNPLRLSMIGARDNISGTTKPQSPTIRAPTQLPAQSSQHSQRTDSVTTFQTDSVRQPSIRSSIATYLSEGSEDLQLPYSITDGLPMGSTQIRRAASTTSDRPRSDRDTILSDFSRSTYTASPIEWSPSVRSSHVVELDPIDRQLLRGEIPSQLFLERPFLGWEAQASIQSAH